MVFYTGGTQYDPLSPGYSFWGNTFSDSGRYIAWSGDFNITSMILFSTGLVIYACCLIPFYLVIWSLFNESESEKRASKRGSIFGIVFSISFIGIAFSPVDILGIYHAIFVFIAYSATVLNGYYYSVTFYKNRLFSNTYAIVFAVYTIFYLITVLMGLYGIFFNILLTVIVQKIGRFTAIGAHVIIGYGILNFRNNPIDK